MKDIQLFQLFNSADCLFNYPCVNPLSSFLQNKKVWVLCENQEDKALLKSIIDNGADVTIYNKFEYIHEKSPAIGIIMPPLISRTEDTVQSYYKIMNYYISFTQMMVHKMSEGNDFRHLLIVLPFEGSSFSASLAGMAYYSISGLIHGLGKMNGNNGLLCLGLELNDNCSLELISNWIAFLISNNSNNIIGEIIKL